LWCCTPVDCQGYSLKLEHACPNVPMDAPGRTRHLAQYAGFKAVMDPTARLCEQQISIGVIAVAQACCEPLL